MPHLVILYTPQLDAEADLPSLCRALADTLLAVRDEAGAPVFPVGGTRVLAYPAAHHAVADGSGDHAFMYLNLRMGRGRSAALHQRVGALLAACVKDRMAPVMARRLMGLTVQVDEGHEVFDARIGNLHAHFARES